MTIKNNSTGFVPSVGGGGCRSATVSPFGRRFKSPRTGLRTGPDRTGQIEGKGDCLNLVLLNNKQRFERQQRVCVAGGSCSNQRFSPWTGCHVASTQTFNSASVPADVPAVLRYLFCHRCMLPVFFPIFLLLLFIFGWVLVCFHSGAGTGR